MNDVSKIIFLNDISIFFNDVSKISISIFFFYTFHYTIEIEEAKSEIIKFFYLFAEQEKQKPDFDYFSLIIRLVDHSSNDNTLLLRATFPCS